MDEEGLIGYYKGLLADTQSLSEMVEERKAKFGLSERQLSDVLGITRPKLSRLLNGEVQKADIVSFLKLQEFLNKPLHELIDSFVASLDQEAISDLERTRKAIFIAENFDIAGLRRVGFLDSGFDIEAIEQRIKKFFGFNNLYQYRTEIPVTLFSKGKTSHTDQMRMFWIKAAYYQFQKINNPNKYDEQLLKVLVPKIKSYSRREDIGLASIIKALYEVGVTVIVQQYLTKTAVYGACFMVNNKPCIVLTDYNKKYHNLWYSLLHELHHILFDKDLLEQVDYHISEDQTELMWREDEANSFAQNILFPINKLEQLRPFIRSHNIVEKFAHDWSVHPSIIYETFCKDLYERKGDNSGFILLSKQRNSSTKALKGLKLNPWAKETALEEIIKLKSKLELT